MSEDKTPSLKELMERQFESGAVRPNRRSQWVQRDQQGNAIRGGYELPGARELNYDRTIHRTRD